jgi:uncharacterized protein YbjT (DUF2867 family)
MNLIVGATGMLGSRIVNRLLDEDRPVRAFVRSSADYQPLHEAGAEIAIGDLRRPETFPQALRDVKNVVVTATAPLMERHLPEAVKGVDACGIQDLIDACKHAGVEQFVFTSAFGFEFLEELPLARAKTATEQHLKQSGLTYTILKPVLFMEAWIGFLVGSQLQNGPRVTIIGDGNVRHSFVSMENVLDLAVGVLEHPAATNAVLPLCAPGAYSYREVIGRIGEIMGAPIEINSVPAGESVPGTPLLIRDAWPMLNSFGDSTLDTSEVIDTYDLKMLGMEECLQQMFAVQTG